LLRPILGAINSNPFLCELQEGAFFFSLVLVMSSQFKVFPFFPFPDGLWASFLYDFDFLPLCGLPLPFFPLSLWENGARAAPPPFFLSYRGGEFFPFFLLNKDPSPSAEGFLPFFFFFPPKTEKGPSPLSFTPRTPFSPPPPCSFFFDRGTLFLSFSSPPLA